MVLSAVSAPPFVAKLHVLHVVGRGTTSLRLPHHLIGRHVDELGALVNESLDEPGTRDSVDPWVLAGDPFHRSFSLRTLGLYLDGARLMWRRQRPRRRRSR